MNIMTACPIHAKVWNVCAGCSAFCPDAQTLTKVVRCLRDYQLASFLSSLKNSHWTFLVLGGVLSVCLYKIYNLKAKNERLKTEQESNERLAMLDLKKKAQQIEGVTTSLPVDSTTPNLKTWNLKPEKNLSSPATVQPQAIRSLLDKEFRVLEAKLESNTFATYVQPQAIRSLLDEEFRVLEAKLEANNFAT